MGQGFFLFFRGIEIIPPGQLASFHIEQVAKFPEVISYSLSVKGFRVAVMEIYY